MNERSVFLAALDISDPADRSAYLDKACATEPVLRRQVEQLLIAHHDPGSFMDGPAANLIATIDRPVAERPGTVIGPYKLLEQIGEGGFGVVFMAEQQQPLRRKVALKVLKPGMDTRQVVARFEAERQALALMDHPNIAHVFDGGTTETGRPYFVMELVRGVPVTGFCDQGCLGIDQRLKLFVDVCQAVQHAHQKGVIHRDIKPTNVMVTLYDGKPVVKVIDFGIAKAMGQQLTEKTLFTNFAHIIGTPLYMSPEQAEMSGLDVDTRSDVYSLGVLLYELLTGATPFENDRLSEVGYDEMRRIIREEEPPKPSMRISTAGKLATTASQKRQGDPRRLSKMFQGELDWIVMKALEKDRDRRYETANAFALDVERYLNDEPVVACPPSASYRLRKFARRNKVPVLATGILLVTLIGGITGTSIGMLRALKAEENAEASFQRVRRTVDEMYTKVAEKWLVDQPKLEPLQREFLQKALEFYADFAQQTSNDPAIRLEAATASQRVALIQYKLGDVAQAEPAFKQAVKQMQKLVDDIPEVPAHRQALAETLREFATLLAETGRVLGAREAYQRAIAIHEQLVSEYPDNVDYRCGLAQSHSLAANELSATQHAESERSFRRSLIILEELTAAFPSVPEYRQYLADSLHGLGKLLINLGRADEGRKFIRDAVAIEERLVAELPLRRDHRSQLAFTYDTLARSLSSNEAEPLLRKALAFQRDLAGDYPAVANYQYDIVRSLQQLALVTHADEAEDLLREAVAMGEKLERDTPDVEFYRLKLITVYGQLANLLVHRGRADEALAFSEKLAVLASDIPSELTASLHAATGNVEGYRRICHEILRRLGDTDDPVAAERTAKTCLLMREALGAEDFERVQKLAERAVTGTEKHGYYHYFALAKGLAEYRAGQDAEAIQWLERFPPSVTGIHWDATKFAVLAMAHHRMGRSDEAQKALTAATTIIARMPDPDNGKPFGDCDWLHAQVLVREAEELLGIR